MRVLYTYEMRVPFPPGRYEAFEVEMDVADLPPLAAKEVAKRGIEAMYGEFYLWEYAGATLWWWVRPVPS